MIEDGANDSAALPCEKWRNTPHKPQGSHGVSTRLEELRFLRREETHIHPRRRGNRFVGSRTCKTRSIMVQLFYQLIAKQRGSYDAESTHRACRMSLLVYGPG